MLNCIICDDNIGSAELLKRKITAVPGSDASVMCVESFRKANELVSDETDVVFMDILLSEANGIDCAAELKKHYPQLRIVFITAFAEYCEKIFKAQPIGFLVKPFRDESVKDVLRIINNSLKKEEHTIMLQPSKSAAVRVDLDRILYIENSNRKLLFRGEDSAVLFEIKMSLHEVEKLLPVYFVHCHYSFFVNMSRVTGIKRFFFTLSDAKTVPISQSKFNQTRDTYFHYLGEKL